jgi:4,5:9,10-diseco-3-hydroxy-5,9,17-trioxoandrosta-1(10),2-diene-4-oate hydrolase
MPMPVPADRYIKVGNINTRYRASGDKGTPVILVHGLGGSIENWVYNVESLGQHHRVYAPDLKGFGRSDKTPVLHDIDELVQFISDFMAVQHIDKASLAGNSLGGGLVLQFAIRFPDKVDKLVLVDNAGMGSDVIVDFKLASLPVLGELLSRPSLKGTANLWRKVVFDASLVTEELVAQTYKLATLSGASKALLATLRAGIGIRGQRANLTRPLIESAAKIAVPTLIIWGQQDRIIPVAHAHIAAETIPRARLEIFDRCGHMPQMERPDQFNALVLEFLAG